MAHIRSHRPINYEERDERHTHIEENKFKWKWKKTINHHCFTSCFIRRKTSKSIKRIDKAMRESIRWTSSSSSLQTNAPIGNYRCKWSNLIFSSMWISVGNIRQKEYFLLVDNHVDKFIICFFHQNNSSCIDQSQQQIDLLL